MEVDRSCCFAGSGNPACMKDTMDVWSGYYQAKIEMLSMLRLTLDDHWTFLQDNHPIQYTPVRLGSGISHTMFSSGETVSMWKSNIISDLETFAYEVCAKIPVERWPKLVNTFTGGYKEYKTLHKISLLGVEYFCTWMLRANFILFFSPFIF